jgi:hypothetical protein
VLSLFIITRRHARVHRLPLTVPVLVDCCLFTPAVPATIITVAGAVTSATTIAATAAAVVTDVVVNTTAINTLPPPPLSSQPLSLLPPPSLPRPLLPLSPTMAAPATSAEVDADANADANANANAAAATADAYADAAPLPPRRCHRRHWCQTPSLPYLHLTLVFNAVKRCHRCRRHH